MLDWLKRPAREVPSLDLAGRSVPVEVRRLAHARRLTLRIAPDGSAVRITIPQWAPTAEALAFARSRSAWLEAQLARVPQGAPLLPGAPIPWRGSPRALMHDPVAARRIRLLPDALQVGGPAESLAPRLRRWMQGEARQLFAADLADYVPRAAVEMPALALSNAQRRWGSCSASRIIRLNWRLGMAPDHVRRSVVAHEVAHLVHFDHSTRFHSLLGEIFEHDIDDANDWLKRHGRTLYAPLG